jgi:hypothetical protein
MIEWGTVLSTIGGAVLGGLGTGTMIQIRLEKSITRLETQVKIMADSCISCRGSVETHHTDHAKLVKEAVSDQIGDHSARITRIEDRMINGRESNDRRFAQDSDRLDRLEGRVK